MNDLAEVIADPDQVRAAAGARFVNIGERTNVTGSAKFEKLMTPARASLKSRLTPPVTSPRLMKPHLLRIG